MLMARVNTTLQSIFFDSNCPPYINILKSSRLAMPGQTGTEYKDFSIVLAIFTQACLLTCLPSIMPDKKPGVGPLPALTPPSPALSADI